MGKVSSWHVCETSRTCKKESGHWGNADSIRLRCVRRLMTPSGHAAPRIAAQNGHADLGSTECNQIASPSE
jgi:hypothetical protein